MTTPATPAADAVSLPDEFENVLFAEWLEAACVHVGAFGEVDGASEEDVRQLIRVCRERQTEAATARESALVAERDALRAEVAKLMRVAVSYSDIISNHCIAMQSAVIDADLVSPQSGLAWIRNTLCGPGLLPDLEEARALGGAQAWFDAKTAEEEARKAALAAPAVEGE